MTRIPTRMWLVTLAMLAMSAAPAAAKVPGPNGRIVYGIWDPAIEAQHLFTVNPDGSDVRDLSVISDVNAWSPDGSKILITDLQTGPPLRPATINPDGSGFLRLDATSDPLLHLACGSWSPEGDRIACQGFTDEEPSEKNGMYTVRSSDGGGLVRLTHARPPGDVPGDYSPDESRIVFLHSDPSPHACFECGALFVVNTDGSGVRQITPPDFAHGAGSWSPDGRWILFGARRGKLYIVHPDGTELQRIPLHDGPGRSFAGSASWSPDGTRILFSMFWKPNGYQPDIFTARPDGSDLEQVTDTPEFEHTSDWGPSTG